MSLRWGMGRRPLLLRPLPNEAVTVAAPMRRFAVLFLFASARAA